MVKKFNGIPKIVYLALFLLLFLSGCYNNVIASSNSEEKNELIASPSKKKVFFISNEDDNSAKIVDASGNILLKTEGKEIEWEYDNAEYLGIIEDKFSGEQKFLYKVLKKKLDYTEIIEGRKKYKNIKVIEKNKEINNIYNDEKVEYKNDDSEYIEENDNYEHYYVSEYTIYNLKGNEIGLRYYGQSPFCIGDKLYYIDEFDICRLYNYDIKNKLETYLGNCNEILLFDNLFIGVNNSSNYFDEGIFILNTNNSETLQLDKYSFDSFVEFDNKKYVRINLEIPKDYNSYFYNLIDLNLNKLYAEPIKISDSIGLYEELQKIYKNDYKLYAGKMLENNIKSIDNAVFTFKTNNMNYYIIRNCNNNTYFIMDENKNIIGSEIDKKIDVLTESDKLEEIFFSIPDENMNRKLFHILNNKFVYFNDEDINNHLLEHIKNGISRYGYYYTINDNESIKVKNINSNFERSYKSIPVNYYRIKGQDFFEFINNYNKEKILYSVKSDKVIAKGFKNEGVLGDFFVVIYNDKVKIYDSESKLYKLIDDKTFDYMKEMENKGEKILVLSKNDGIEYRYDLFDKNFNLKIENSDMPYPRIKDNKTHKTVHDYLLVSPNYMKNRKDMIIDFKFNKKMEFRNSVADIEILRKSNHLYYLVTYLRGKGYTVYNEKFKVVADYDDSNKNINEIYEKFSDSGIG